jgi:prevent-host-death family protein
MKVLNISTDIVPLGEFRTALSKWLKNIKNTGQPLVITQNGKPAGVLLSPEEYDDLIYTKRFLESVSQGILQADRSETYSTKELKSELSKSRMGRKSR